MIHPEIEKAHLLAEKLILSSVLEILALELHKNVSPTSWTHLTTEQRNSTRRRAAGLVNEASDFWQREERKEQAPL